MTAHDVNGNKFEISQHELQRLVSAAGGGGMHNTAPSQESRAALYADATEHMMKAAQNELREETGDYPEDFKELYEFAVKHDLFGDREDVHIMVNYLKVFFCLLQKETHDVQDE